MSYFKNNPVRSKKYTDWVKSLPSVLSDLPADDPHHLIGYGEGGTSTKACDLFTFPLTRPEHNELHRIGWREWEEIHGSQWQFVSKTLQKAIKDGIIQNLKIT